MVKYRPFDWLAIVASGDSEKGNEWPTRSKANTRGDRTPLELFLAGVRNSGAVLWQILHVPQKAE
jgi:hypothetical protein